MTYQERLHALIVAYERINQAKEILAGEQPFLAGAEPYVRSRLQYWEQRYAELSRSLGINNSASVTDEQQ